jgi:hypothetical protein
MCAGQLLVCCLATSPQAYRGRTEDDDHGERSELANQAPHASDSSPPIRRLVALHKVETGCLRIGHPPGAGSA